MATNCCCLAELGIPALGLACLGLGFSRFSMAQKILNTATSKVRGSAVGLVELKGKIVLDKGVISPIFGRECAFYRVTFKRNGKPVFYAMPKKVPSFYIDDGTGRMLIRTESAEFRVHNGRSVKGYFTDKDKKGNPVQQFEPKIMKYIESLGGGSQEIIRWIEGRGPPDQSKVLEWFIHAEQMAAFAIEQEIEIVEESLAAGDEAYVIGNAEPIEGAAKGALSHERLEVRKGLLEQVLLISDQKEGDIAEKLKKEALVLIFLGVLVLVFWGYDLLNNLI